MKRRLLSFSFALALVFTFCTITTFAIENRASETLSSYAVYCKPGDKSGTIYITYDVKANSRADSLGVSSIALYNSSGIYMTTILGSTENGLIKSNLTSASGTYTQTVVSGNSYYAVATVFAEIGNKYDSRTVTTKIATAP